MSMYDRFSNSALYSDVSMFPRFKIMARKADGTEFDCFTWTRDEASGIRRAWSDAEKFGVEIVDVWAVAL